MGTIIKVNKTVITGHRIRHDYDTKVIQQQYDTRIKDKSGFNIIEREIMRRVYHHPWPMTTYELSKDIGISFPTTKKYAQGLLKKGIILSMPPKKKKSSQTFVFNKQIIQQG